LFTPAGTPQAAYVRSFGVPSSRIRIAQLTVDVAAIQTWSNAFTLDRRAKVRSCLQLANDNIAILYVGRLEPHKGVEDLLAAFMTLRGRLPNARLLLAGDGSLRDRVIAAAAEMPAIHYLGRLADETLWEAYNIADIFVLPSRFEPWGLVVNEAMAAGLPVVVTDRVGCGPDLVQHGVTGLVVPAASVTALSTALETTCAETDWRRYMGSQARQLISQWTLANQARNTTAAWRQALAP
jgi:glycosyltransferase involved in cell wall biosynthesis